MSKELVKAGKKPKDIIRSERYKCMCAFCGAIHRIPGSLIKDGQFRLICCDMGNKSSIYYIIRDRKKPLNIYRVLTCDLKTAIVTAETAKAARKLFNKKFDEGVNRIEKIGVCVSKKETPGVINISGNNCEDYWSRD